MNLTMWIIKSKKNNNCLPTDSADIFISVFHSLLKWTTGVILTFAELQLLRNFLCCSLPCECAV